MQNCHNCRKSTVALRDYNRGIWPSRGDLKVRRRYGGKGEGNVLQAAFAEAMEKAGGWQV